MLLFSNNYHNVQSSTGNIKWIAEADRHKSCDQSSDEVSIFIVFIDTHFLFIFLMYFGFL